MSEEDKDYYVPLEDQRVFGAGIKRKRIAFVPATSTEPTTPITAPPPPTSNIADKYLSIVGLSRAASAPPTSAASTPTPSSSTDSHTTAATTAAVCAVCARPLSPTHESTIAHQVCLAHSHPPSHLDRSRAGVRYLAAYGWDPDERVGLGARAEGMRFPIKPVPKHDTVGLHERVDADSQAQQVKVRKSAAVAAKQREQQGRVVRLDAKKLRKRDDEARRKAEKLRNLFYASDDVEKYLGEGG